MTVTMNNMIVMCHPPGVRMQNILSGQTAVTMATRTRAARGEADAPLIKSSFTRLLVFLFIFLFSPLKKKVLHVD